MNRDDWERLLPVGSGANVEFWNPEFDQGNPWFHEDFLLVSFPHGIHLEVVWNDSKDVYVVRLTKDRFQTLIDRRYCASPAGVPPAVRQLATRAFEERFRTSISFDNSYLVNSILTRHAGQPSSYPYRQTSIPAGYAHALSASTAQPKFRGVNSDA